MISGFTYQEYLHTDLWKSRRMQAIRDAKYRCEQCGSMVRLQVHHKVYSNLGNEKPEELQVLCEECHHKYHNK